MLTNRSYPCTPTPASRSLLNSNTMLNGHSSNGNGILNNKSSLSSAIMGNKYTFSSRFVIIVLLLTVVLVSLLWNIILLLNSACFDPTHTTNNSIFPSPISPTFVSDNEIVNDFNPNPTDLAIKTSQQGKIKAKSQSDNFKKTNIITAIDNTNHPDYVKGNFPVYPPPDVSVDHNQHPAIPPSNVRDPFNRGGNKPTFVRDPNLDVNSLVINPEFTPLDNPIETYKARHLLWSKEVTDSLTNRCAGQFGNAFSEKIELCEMDSSNSLPSSYNCYSNPILSSTHCELKNFELDLGRITSAARGGESIESVRFQAEDDEYLQYGHGSFTFNCKENSHVINDAIKQATKAKKEKYFPNHLEKVAVASQFGTAVQCDRWESTPTIFVTRYEFANLFHSLTLWYNIYQAENLFNLHDVQDGSDTFSNVDIIFLDAHSASSLDPIWGHLFHSVRYARHLPVEKICFKRALLISPGYRSSIGVPQMNKNKSKCYYSALLNDFSVALLQSFRISQLISDPNDNNKLITKFAVPNENYERLYIPTIDGKNVTLVLTPNLKIAIFIVRRDYIAHPRASPSGSVQRQLFNEKELLAITNRLFEEHGYQFFAVDFVQLSMREQMNLYHYCSFVVSLHGAALAHVLSSNPNTVTIELRPRDYSGRETFQYLSQWLSRTYVHMQIEKADARSKIGHNVDTEAYSTRLSRILKESDAGTLMKYAEFRGISTIPLQIKSPAIASSSCDFPEIYKEQKSQTQSPASSPIVPTIRETKTYESIPEVQIVYERVSTDDINTNNNNNNVNNSPSPTLNVSPLSSGEHRLCLLVPFRDSQRISKKTASPTSQSLNRTENLIQFIPTITEHLNRVGNHNYKIIIIEQYDDDTLFNKGALFNIGYEMAKKSPNQCDYMILHDVDQVPESTQNTYTFPNSRAPLHMCIATSNKGYRPAYQTMVGGVLAITMDQYEKLNGYSNEYWGWGQEDDDFYFRIFKTFHHVDRLSPAIGRYTALHHSRVHDLDATPIFQRGSKRLKLMSTNTLDFSGDGINSLAYQLIHTEPNLYGNMDTTKYSVKLEFTKMPQSLDDPNFVN